MSVVATPTKARLFSPQWERAHTVETCPNCGISLVKRYNKSSGEIFYGCQNYPKCKFSTSKDLYQRATQLRSKREVQKKREERYQEILRLSEKIVGEGAAIDAVRKKMASENKADNYHEYIRGKVWAKKALAAKERSRWRCQVCNRPSSEVVLNAHHRTYERLYFESEHDIIVLCEECHKMYHESKKLPPEPSDEEF